MPADCWNEVGVWAAGGATCPRLAEVVHCHNCDVFARAGRGLLDQPAPPGYLESWAEELARPKEGEDAASLSLFVFRIGEEWLALPATAVSEVAEVLPVRRIPRRAAGLVNVHGELHLCFSMSAVLGIAADEHAGRTVVIGNADGQWVFPADEVWGLLSISAHGLDDVPATIARDARAHVRYIVDWERGKISCLDEKLLFTTLQRRVREI
jgi:chemotaxis-related protein WspD